MSENSFIDYYKDLQVSSNADIKTIERVYRLLAKRYHPDNHDTDNGSYSITANGVDVVEENELILGKDRLITYNDGLSKHPKGFEGSDNGRRPLPKVVGQEL